MNTLWLLIVTFAFALGQALLFRAFDLKHLKYERRFSQKTAYEGQNIELLELIENKKVLPVPWLRAESRIPREISFDKEKLDSTHLVSGGMYHKSLFFIAPMSAVRRHHAITLKKRGLYSAGSVALSAGDLFSMARSERQLDLDCGITVYPALLSDDELPDPANRWIGEASVKRWIMPDPFLVNGIRAYAEGDSLKDIHWKASARTGELSVKVRDYTADPKALVVLNVQTSELQWADVAPDEAETIEYGIRIAATMCVRAIRYGLSAGFASNACFENTKGRGKGIYIPPSFEGAQSEKILDAMAKMILHREVNFHTFLGDLADVTGEDILIISCYKDGETAEAIDRLRSQGNSVAVLQLERRRMRA